MPGKSYVALNFISSDPLTTMLAVYFRKMEAADLALVYKLQEAADSFHWNLQQLQACQEKSNANPGSNSNSSSDTNFDTSIDYHYDCWLCCQEDTVSTADQIVAFTISSSVLDESSLLNLCVAQDFKGQGYGRATLDHLIRQGQADGIRKIFLEVRESNIPAIALYQSSGFEQIDIRENYYPSPTGRENAKIYVLQIESSDESVMAN